MVTFSVDGLFSVRYYVRSPFGSGRCRRSEISCFTVTKSECEHGEGGPQAASGAAGTHLGTGSEAQLRGAAQAREGADGGHSRHPGPDRAGLRGDFGGGRGAPAVVRPVPRQAQGGALHDAGQAAGRTPDAAQAAHHRPGLPGLRGRLRRADHAAEHPAPRHEAERPARDLRDAEPGRAVHERRLRRHGAEHHGLPGGGSRRRRTVQRPSGHRGGGRFLLRQPRLLRSAPQAQDHHLLLPPPVQRA